MERQTHSQTNRRIHYNTLQPYQYEVTRRYDKSSHSPSVYPRFSAYIRRERNCPSTTARTSTSWVNESTCIGTWHILDHDQNSIMHTTAFLQKWQNKNSNTLSMTIFISISCHRWTHTMHCITPTQWYSKLVSVINWLIVDNTCCGKNFSKSTVYDKGPRETSLFMELSEFL